MDAKICEKRNGTWRPKFGLCDFKKMREPKYSSLKWKPMHINGRNIGLKSDEEHIIAKGAASALLKEQGLKHIVENAANHQIIAIKIKPQILHYQQRSEKDIIDIGNSTYSKRYLYQIIEEISGEKIVTDESRDGNRRIVKSAVDKIFKLNIMQNPQEELNPLIIEGNRGYYLLAPRIKD